ncbi:hypothetical protein Tco_1011381 [Tanacetum coccineum]
MSSDDERGEEKELDHSSPEVVTKYKSAAEIVNKALRLVLSQCKPDHFSPLASDETVLKWFHSCGGTHTCSPRRPADFIAAANTAAEVALMLVQNSCWAW